MQIEKKLILCSILAISIGIATIAPLGLFLSTQFDKEAQFNISVEYAYVDNYCANDTAKIANNYGWVYSMVFETSPKYNLKDFPFNLFPYADAVEEYYVIELRSEKGSIGNFSVSTTQYSLNGYRTAISGFERNLFSHNASNVFSQGISGFVNGTSVGYVNGPITNLDTSMGKPETLVLTVRREGWAIYSNNATTIHVAGAEIIEELTLESYGEGFIYNNLFTPEALSQMNPVMPQYEVLK
ncbi:MAG TPA: hypothetical protein VLH35_00535 [Candidatus Acidoferrales bacterium]|nr:hypothetical protein [Candidatus Acidoferrales bacterium]